jgi:hypothetical protein
MYVLIGIIRRVGVGACASQELAVAVCRFTIILVLFGIVVRWLFAVVLTRVAFDAFASQMPFVAAWQMVAVVAGWVVLDAVASGAPGVVVPVAPSDTAVIVIVTLAALASCVSAWALTVAIDLWVLPSDTVGQCPRRQWHPHTARGTHTTRTHAARDRTRAHTTRARRARAPHTRDTPHLSPDAWGPCGSATAFIIADGALMLCAVGVRGRRAAVFAVDEFDASAVALAAVWPQCHTQSLIACHAAVALRCGGGSAGASLSRSHSPPHLAIFGIVSRAWAQARAREPRCSGS